MSPPGPNTPVPYCGHRLERRERLGQSYLEAPDPESGAPPVPVAINALGYRGPEWVPDAPLTVFAFGESDAFGMGLAFEDCWPSRVVSRLAEERGLASEEVGYLNFAESGASNASIARQVLTQCEAVRPDFVLVNFADPLRTEGHWNGRTYQVGDWFGRPLLERSLERLPRGSELRSDLEEQLRRGRAYLEFTNLAHGQLEALRSVLLVQHYLADRGIRGVATIRNAYDLARNGVAEDPAIAPLLHQVDREFLVPESLETALVAPDVTGDGAHYGPAAHDALARRLHARLDGSGERPRSDVTGDTSRAVRAFYEGLPFNYHGSLRRAARSVRERSLSANYPDLARLLESGSVERVLDLGCGAGWLTATLAKHYSVEVTGVDFCSGALHRARELTEELGVSSRVRFLEADLFEYAPDGEFDLVVSLGVLHHTRDARAALLHMLGLAERFAYVGLYHEPGRRPFFDHFRSLVESKGEYAAFRSYCELDAARDLDETHAFSWFRDQVQHPHETQHTLHEVCEWLADGPWRVRSSSLNGFRPIDDLKQLLASEGEFESRSRRALHEEKRFFPGFFTALLER